METTVNHYLGELLKQFSGSINSIGDFAREQIPDVISQFVLYHLVVDAITIMGIVIGLIISWIVLKRLLTTVNRKVESAGIAFSNKEPWTRWQNDVESDTTSHRFDLINVSAFIVPIVGWFLFGFALLCALTPLFSTTVELIKIVVAPKIWLIEQAIEMSHTVTGK